MKAIVLAAVLLVVPGCNCKVADKMLVPDECRNVDSKYVAECTARVRANEGENP